MAKNERNDSGPWHIVNRMTGQHCGPFSSKLDCAMARSIATPDWATGIDMDNQAFEHMGWNGRALDALEGTGHGGE